jgi:hypothetical protein
MEEKGWPILDDLRRVATIILWREHRAISRLTLSFRPSHS